MNVRWPRRDDLPTVLALIRANDETDAGVTDWTEKDLSRHWAELDLGRAAWLVELDDRPAGYLDVQSRGGGRVIGDGYVDPELRGRGVGSELLRLAEGRALELALEGRA